MRVGRSDGEAWQRIVRVRCQASPDADPSSIGPTRRASRARAPGPDGGRSPWWPSSAACSICGSLATWSRSWAWTPTRCFPSPGPPMPAACSLAGRSSMPLRCGAFQPKRSRFQSTKGSRRRRSTQSPRPIDRRHSALIALSAPVGISCWCQTTVGSLTAITASGTARSEIGLDATTPDGTSCAVGAPSPERRFRRA